jgi:hypothetical protein
VSGHVDRGTTRYRPAVATGAAFFDLDRTLLRGASGPVIGEALKRAGVTDRSMPGQDVIYKLYDLFGENRPSMEVTRRAVRFCSPSPGPSSRSTEPLAGRSSWPPPRPTTS